MTKTEGSPLRAQCEPLVDNDTNLVHSSLYRGISIVYWSSSGVHVGFRPLRFRPDYQVPILIEPLGTITLDHQHLTRLGNSLACLVVLTFPCSIIRRWGLPFAEHRWPRSGAYFWMSKSIGVHRMIGITTDRCEFAKYQPNYWRRLFFNMLLLLIPCLILRPFLYAFSFINFRARVASTEPRSLSTNRCRCS